MKLRVEEATNGWVVYVIAPGDREHEAQSRLVFTDKWSLTRFFEEELTRWDLAKPKKEEQAF